MPPVAYRSEINYDPNVYYAKQFRNPRVGAVLYDSMLRPAGRLLSVPQTLGDGSWQINVAAKNQEVISIRIPNSRIYNFPLDDSPRLVEEDEEAVPQIYDDAATERALRAILTANCTIYEGRRPPVLNLGFPHLPLDPPSSHRINPRQKESEEGRITHRQVGPVSMVGSLRQLAKEEALRKLAPPGFLQEHPFRRFTYRQLFSTLATEKEITAAKQPKKTTVWENRRFKEESALLSY